MLLSITATGDDAGDLTYLLHKRPDRFQSFPVSFGKVHVFYPAVDPTRCTACLMLDIDPIGMARKHRDERSPLAAYVNDRPLVASSFLSTALSQVYGTAMNGRCRDRPDAVETVRELTTRIECLPVRGGESFLRSVFEPLGYDVDVESHPLDPQFESWGDSVYLTVTLSSRTTVQLTLQHLYVLMPVFDNAKHYFIGEAEIEKLLAKGAGWLETHPMKTAISRRYLRHRGGLVRQALRRLQTEPTDEHADGLADDAKVDVPVRLHDQRHAVVIDRLKATGVSSVVDLGCGDGKLLRRLASEKSFSKIVGVDVSVRTLELAAKRLRLDRFEIAEYSLRPDDEDDLRLRLFQGSVLYRDRRLRGFDAACLVEVIEHLEPTRLDALAGVVFGDARPRFVLVTTPNVTYNAVWELPPGHRRHGDHRFEWDTAQFQTWCRDIGQRYGYGVTVEGVGEPHETLGCPSQLAVFELVAAEDSP